MLADILKTKFDAVDTESESAARAEVDNFYDEARYDGSRFCVPSFEAVGAVWLRLIARKEQGLIQEITRVLRTPGATLDKKGVTAVKGKVEAVFAEGHYIDRLRVFFEGVARKAASYGVTFDPNAHRVDIAESAYRVGTMNALRKARSNVLAELTLQSQAANSTTPDTVRTFFQWLRYIRANPLKALAVILLVIVIPWTFLKLPLGDLLHWLR